MIRSAYFAAIADFCKQTFATQNFLMSQIFANIAILSKRKCAQNGSVAEWLNAPVLKTGDG